jgi:hypothetical protein
MVVKNLASGWCDGGDGDIDILVGLPLGSCSPENPEAANAYFFDWDIYVE